MVRAIAFLHLVGNDRWRGEGKKVLSSEQVIVGLFYRM